MVITWEPDKAYACSCAEYVDFAWENMNLLFRAFTASEFIPGLSETCKSNIPHFGFFQHGIDHWKLNSAMTVRSPPPEKIEALSESQEQTACRVTITADRAGLIEACQFSHDSQLSADLRHKVTWNQGGV